MYRDYTNCDKKVVDFYKENRSNQTYQHVLEMQKKYGFSEFGTNRKIRKMSVWEAIKELDKIVDESDPDTQKSQIYHSIETAEAIKKVYPDKEWLIITGFIHDLGKVLSLCGEPQWNVVGDTFPVGCLYSSKCVFSEFFEYNEDYNKIENNIFLTKLGVYKENCGLDNILMSFGHDEYLYQVLNNSPNNLPEEGKFIIRYHSFYPLHYENEYLYLLNEKDREKLPLLKLFQPFDLYSKHDPDNDSNKNIIDIESLLPYYQNLVNKYFPQDLFW